MEIEILDAVECSLSKSDGQVLLPCLSFESSYWQQGPHKKVRKVYQKDVYSHKSKTGWYFYTGLLPRVKKYCIENKIPLKIVGEEIKIPRQQAPFLKGIEFRDDQLKMINVAVEKGRGVISAATQTGKTLIFLGIISCYPKLNVLILAHSSTIIQQTHERLLKYGFTDVEMFGGGVKVHNPTKRITISTIQSFSKLDPKVYSDYYDMVIIDELHRVSKQVSQYKDVLSKLLAPLRFGFTATPKDDPESELTYEGLVGKIISTLSIQEATKLEILGRPRLKLVKAEYPPNLSTIYKYQDTYEKIKVNGVFVNGERVDVGAYSAGIVENKKRNDQIIDIVVSNMEKGKISFVFVSYTLHGKLLQEGIKQRTGIDVPFVEGSTSMANRDKIKKGLMTKKILVCLASNAWSEGLTITTITDLVLCGGGKSELQLLQKAGRVLANDNITITDFLDLNNKHLLSHCGNRLAVYSEKNWLGQN
jgi:superfamily II DNA or RNA helicase